MGQKFYRIRRLSPYEFADVNTMRSKAQILDLDYCPFHAIYIFSDLACSEFYFGIKPQPPILRIKRAWEIVIKFSSMSKTSSMPGWWTSLAAGNQELVAGLAWVKLYLGNGTFTLHQIAAMAALNGQRDYVDDICTLRSAAAC